MLTHQATTKAAIVGLLLTLLAGSFGCAAGSPPGRNTANRAAVQVGNTQISKSTIAHWEHAMSLGAVSVAGDSDRTKAIGYLVSGNWLIDEAAIRHLTIRSDGPRLWIERQYGAKSRQPRELERELSRKGLDRGDLEFEARIALSAAALRKAITGRVHTAGQAEIEAFYKDHQELFSREQRAVELIETLPSRSYAIALGKRLGTGAKFAKLATPQYVYEPGKGDNDYDIGLLRAIFAAPVGRVASPVLYLGKWTILLVRHVFHEPAPFAEVSTEVAERLRSVRQNQALVAFAAELRREWRAKTACSPGYIAPGCSNSPTILDPTVNPLSG